MAATRKLLVPFDPAKPSWNPNDWLLPVMLDGKVALLSVNTGKSFQYGRVVFVGEPITENDLFTKLVGTGRRIASVDETFALLASFIEAMKTVKIGNVVEAEPDGTRVKLRVVGSSPSAFGK